MRTRIKVCCIQNEEEARLAITCGVDAIGLVGVKPSNPRSISDERIAAVAGEVPPAVASFLLTSETAAEQIVSQVHRTGVSAVQILNNIDPSESAILARELPSVRRVQVVHVEGRSCLNLVDVYAEYVHAFLLDSGRPNAAIPEFGGTGRVHDWDLSRSFVSVSPRPVFLAGGLTPENVGLAIRHVQPFGVDLCSGVRKDGRLDVGRLRDFVAAVRAADDTELESIEQA